VARRELHADDGDEHVERVVREGHRLGVALDEAHGDAGFLGAGTADLEQLGNEVQGGHLGAGLGGRDGGVAGARGDVEQLLARLHGGSGEGGLGDRDHVGIGDGGVVAGSPGGAVAGLELDDLGSGGEGHARSFQNR
jgi:hypothetical protein